MAKKTDATGTQPKGKPVAKKSKSKKTIIDTHQLDLFFTAYNPSVNETEAGEKGKGEPSNKGIEKIISAGGANARKSVEKLAKAAEPIAKKAPLVNKKDRAKPAPEARVKKPTSKAKPVAKPAKTGTAGKKAV